MKNLNIQIKNYLLSTQNNIRIFENDIIEINIGKDYAGGSSTNMIPLNEGDVITGRLVEIGIEFFTLDNSKEYYSDVIRIKINCIDKINVLY